ncbi:LLM class flavin-dependent oxidoreductase [Dehalococcoidia bacterium]|nr:LLM class flavin-dependent oxidoreductase [Dehalococcoidia bacterium]
MEAMNSMKFGIFLGPFHRVGENPTLAFERDLETIAWLDNLGFDEAYIGEHHSGGWETISSPEIFIAVAAERTRTIRLGTGVVSLPYHNPFMVASRIALLDHLTRGRMILGVGPGALVSDAHMFGLDPTRQREMMDEALGLIIRLLGGNEPITYQSDWIHLNEAALQIHPVQKPVPVAVASVQSPSGVRVAGKYGASVLSLSVPRSTVRDTSLKELWRICEETAKEHKQIVKRDNWQLVVPVHIAESRKQAIEDVRVGGGQFLKEYFGGTLGYSTPDVPQNKVVETMVENNQWIVGTPDDCIQSIKKLQELSGGFGGLLVNALEWTTREKVFHSYELMARYVMPVFKGTIASIKRSNEWTTQNREQHQEARGASMRTADAAYYGDKTRPETGPSA